jgi:hypothetical protein
LSFVKSVTMLNRLETILRVMVVIWLYSICIAENPAQKPVPWKP